MRQVIASSQAPKPVGPYSQAVAASGAFVFLSGQLGLDPATGQMAGGGDVAQEAEQVLKNLQAVVEAAGSRLERVVKTTVFLMDMNDFAAFNAVYARFFPGDAPPARSTFQVAKLPLGAKVEVECIALLGHAG